ncbi:MAG: DUF58 domain-containing protein [Polyangiales bacterium]
MARIGGIFSRLRSNLRRAADLFPLSMLGILVAALGFGVLRFYAQGKLDRVLLVVGVTGVALPVLSSLSVVVVTMVTKWRWHRRPIVEPSSGVDTETGVPVSMSTGFPAYRWLPFLRVYTTWLMPNSANVRSRALRGKLVESVRFRRRGMHEQLLRRIVFEDVFGLASLAIRHRSNEVIRILPHLGALNRLHTIHSLAGGDEVSHPMGVEGGDRVDLRRYVAGDPARFIHWKVFGRTRKLMVRVPERAIARALRTNAYLIAAHDDEAAAAVARFCVERQELGMDWSFGADGTSGASSRVSESLDKIVASVDAEGALGLSAFLAEAGRLGPASVVLFAPPSQGDWVDRAIRSLSTLGHPARIVIGVDLATMTGPRAPWLRWVFRSQSSSDTSSVDTQVVQAFQKRGHVVVIVDRATGRWVDLHQIGAANEMARAA